MWRRLLPAVALVAGLQACRAYDHELFAQLTDARGDRGAVQPGDATGADEGPGPHAVGEPDAGGLDAGELDAGDLDTGPRDAGPRDAGPRDAGPRDTGLRDVATGQDTGDGGSTCPAGRRLCGDLCVDLQADLENCGGCGRRCGTEGAL